MDEANKSIHEEHRKRMKEIFTNNGLSAFSDVQKIEFILYFAIPRKDTNPIAHNLLDAFGSFDKVLEAPIENLKQLKVLASIQQCSFLLILKFSSAMAKANATHQLPEQQQQKNIVKIYIRAKLLKSFICFA